MQFTIDMRVKQVANVNDPAIAALLHDAIEKPDEFNRILQVHSEKIVLSTTDSDVDIQRLVS